MIKNYYPTYYLGCNPIHTVRSWAYVRRLIRAARRGDKIPPILIEGERHNGNMLTGTHRAAANDIMSMLGDESHLIDYISIDQIEINEELKQAIDDSDFQRINDIVDR